MYYTPPRIEKRNPPKQGELSLKRRVTLGQDHRKVEIAFRNGLVRAVACGAMVAKHGQLALHILGREGTVWPGRWRTIRHISVVGNLPERDTLSAPTDLVLLDDALARQVAASQGIRYTGTLGILIQAKHQSLVTAVMPLVDAMQHAGFRVSDALKATIQRMTAG